MYAALSWLIDICDIDAGRAVPGLLKSDHEPPKSSLAGTEVVSRSQADGASLTLRCWKLSRGKGGCLQVPVGTLRVAVLVPFMPTWVGHLRVIEGEDIFVGNR